MAAQIGSNKTFNMAVDEVIELALEGIGGENVNHVETRHARTSLNLVFIDLQNRGMAPLASIGLVSVGLTSGSSEDYPLGSATFNVMDAVVQVSTSGSGGITTDLPIERISYTEWLDIPTKDTEGRPTHFMVNRQREQPLVNLWPVPDNSTKYAFRAWTLQKIADVDASHQLLDIPHRYLPAIVRGLRYYMADLRGVPLDERAWLKQEYYESLQNALDEDRERVNFHVYPTGRTGYYRGG